MFSFLASYLRRYKTRLSVGFSNTVLILVISLQSCQTINVKDGDELTLNSEDFNEVELNSDVENKCSPNVSADFAGIVIDAPSEVEFTSGKNIEDGTFVRFPICGFYQLDMAALLKDSNIIILAKNIDTGQIYRGEMIDKDPSLDAELPFLEPELSQEEVKGQLLGAYFNINLAKYIDLPIREARYNVQFNIGKYKSNAVAVNVVEK